LFQKTAQVAVLLSANISAVAVALNPRVFGDRCDRKLLCPSSVTEIGDSPVREARRSPQLRHGGNGAIGSLRTQSFIWLVWWDDSQLSQRFT
jgi:hypothetical protein